VKIVSEQVFRRTKKTHPIGAFTESVNSDCEKVFKKISWQEVPFSGGLAVKERKRKKKFCSKGSDPHIKSCAFAMRSCYGKYVSIILSS
jgi:hypothetical protein